MMTVYKLVRRLPDGTSSLMRAPTFCSVISNEPDWCLEYRIDKWTEPKVAGTYIYAFNSYKAALSFLRSERSLFGTLTAILVCEADVVESHPVICSYLRSDRLHDWWKLELMEHHWFHEAPEGSVWCRKVKPLIEVENV